MDNCERRAALKKGCKNWRDGEAQVENDGVKEGQLRTDQQLTSKNGRQLLVNQSGDVFVGSGTTSSEAGEDENTLINLFQTSDGVMVSCFY